MQMGGPRNILVKIFVYPQRLKPLREKAEAVLHMDPPPDATVLIGSLETSNYYRDM